MADVDMKQKIKEVRDKFLSNNQIEDIRQNITLGVEERLKFLNTEQIKVVELLEEKHKELSNELKHHAEKVNTNWKAFESLLENKTLDLNTKLKDQAIALESSTILASKETNELETRLKKLVEDSVADQACLLTSNIAQISKNMDSFRAEIERKDNNIREEIVRNETQIKEDIDKQQKEIGETQEQTKKSVESKIKEMTNAIDEKLDDYETSKKNFLKDTSSKVSDLLSKVDYKIESFVENHKLVEDIIDSRLEEFRRAQKAAFEELEAALSLLEKHQDETINRFKNKSELGIGKHINLPTTSPKNRGSILHQPKDSPEKTLTSEQTEIPHAHQENKKNSFHLDLPRYIAIFGVAFLLGVTMVNYFDFDLNNFLRLAKKISD